MKMLEDHQQVNAISISFSCAIHVLFAMLKKYLLNLFDTIKKILVHFVNIPYMVIISLS